MFTLLTMATFFDDILKPTLRNSKYSPLSISCNLLKINNAWRGRKFAFLDGPGKSRWIEGNRFAYKLSMNLFPLFENVNLCTYTCNKNVIEDLPTTQATVGRNRLTISVSKTKLSRVFLRGFHDFWKIVSIRNERMKLEFCTRTDTSLGHSLKNFNTPYNIL